MKKLLAFAGILLALGMGSAFAKKASNENKVKVVTTIFPEYDWVKEIVGEKADDVELTLLLNNGVDLHSYQPSVKDIAKIQEADIFVYVGGESDEWVDDVLKNVKKPNQKVINLLEVLGDKVKAEEVVEGMEHEHHHGHDHDEHGHEHDEEITEADIKPRSVSEFAGEWQSLYPVLMTGALDEYVEFQAEKKSISVKDSRAEIEAKWNCGIKTIKIKGDEITLIYDNGKKESGSYKYAGFATKKNDQGKISSIRHKFSLVKGNGPKYVMLNDHGHEPVKSVEHFHIYFGNNNFDELVTTKSNPFFVDSKLDAKGCLANVMGHEKGHNHGHEAHEHEHHHDEHAHGKEVKTFDDHDVKDRSLSDWAGEWQSPYPFVLDGSLDEAWEEKAEDGKKTAAEYKEYYKTGYKTDIASVSIKGDKITYKYDNGKTVSAKYKYVGYFIQLWSGGTKGAMYRFERTDKKSDAPKFIEINDHMIEPAKAEHFHLRMSNESFDAIVDPEKYWPTFFPASMSAHEIGEHLSGHHKHHEHDHDHEEELDEHVWLSLKNAQILTSAICDALCQADSKNAGTYKKNLASYNAKLSDLDSKYEAAVKAASKNTLLFGDRFPFRYLVDDYGLKYFAAFSGCSAESEASFKTIVFLSEKVNELDLQRVCQIESGNGKIAKTVISNSKNKKAKVLTLDSLQSTTAKQIKKGATYLGAMEKNLEVLKEALK